MNTLKSVLKHLNKEENVELSSEVVELNVAKEASSLIKMIDSVASREMKVKTMFTKVKSEYRDIIAEAEKIDRESKGLIDDVSKKLKELGLDFSDAPNEIKQLTEFLPLKKNIESDLNKQGIKL